MYEDIDLTLSCWQAFDDYTKHFGFEYPIYDVCTASSDMVEKDIRERIRTNNPAPKMEIPASVLY